ncbi:MAG: hypothetical protein Q7U82_18350 [Gammaproteobacteria bacterium]|nr:hypothetical protein [Gammaproteobacteria bacterium]
MRVKVSKEGAEELETEALWYEAEQPGLGAKRLPLHRFPFSLLMIHYNDEMVVIAFAPFRQFPNYWMSRLRQ